MQDFGQIDVKPYLTTKSLVPENQETPIQFSNNDIVHPKLFYRRNHFTYPNFTFYFLTVEGLVHTSKAFSLQDIYSFPSKNVKAVLECSGNKRGLFQPKVFGEQWGKGAISQGIWKGVSLRILLQHTGLLNTAKEIVFEGHDFGERPDSNRIVHFSRSLPIEIALDPDTIIAYQYNSRPIPFKHGFPLRLIVPGWYGMASVKWIKKITVIDRAFKGPFQAKDYIYYPNKENEKGKFPVTNINVNSTIQFPREMQLLHKGIYEIKGIAWTGKGSIEKVEISFDEGHTWEPCQLDAIPQKYAWVSWNYKWNAANDGEYAIRSKATDTYGNVQPFDPFWNKKGYGYNAHDRIKVKIE
ncbi:sulfite oxidase [Fictibacillus sp. NRS-1165]|uniref:sulfite oxidase n=1 Tax=Fictibacillus sp. NRS-1165 TaxID=3144463 RepID=UPI003D1F04F6